MISKEQVLKPPASVAISGGVGEGGVCLGMSVCQGGCTPLPPVDRIVDAHLRKHNLPATTVAGGKKIIM